MAKPHHDTDKTPAEVQDRIWELAEKIDICMFTTWDGERQRSRPLSARVHRVSPCRLFPRRRGRAEELAGGKIPYRLLRPRR